MPHSDPKTDSKPDSNQPENPTSEKFQGSKIRFPHDRILPHTVYPTVHRPSLRIWLAKQAAPVSISRPSQRGLSLSLARLVGGNLTLMADSGNPNTIEHFAGIMLDDVNDSVAALG
jgi:hypothetical protein